MKIKMNYRSAAWWAWAAIAIALLLNLAGYTVGYRWAFWLSVANLMYYIYAERSLLSFPVQVRMKWLFLLFLAETPAFDSLSTTMLVGVLLLLVFDWCPIARVLIRMPWNAGVTLR